MIAAAQLLEHRAQIGAALDGAASTSRASDMALAGLADALGLPFQLVEPLLETHGRASECDDHQPQRLLVANRPLGTLADDFLHAERPRAQRLVNLQGEHVVDTRHHSLLTLHGLVTRHVAGALLTARQWLQRRAWVRRAAMPWSRPSGTTTPGSQTSPAPVDVTAEHVGVGTPSSVIHTGAELGGAR